MLNQLKSAIKHTSTFHKAGTEKNIFLFSMPRSGTTWLMEIIATQPGFKIVNEPFNLRKDVVRDNLGLQAWDSLMEIGSLPKIATYMQHFIEGRDSDLRYFRQAPFSDLWKLRTNRIIFKLLFVGEGDFDWFADTFNGEIVYLVRHPIPVSLSRAVHPRLQSFVESDHKRHFSQDQLAYAQEIIFRGDKFECAVVDWCFQNAVALRKIKPDWLVLSYEQMVMEPTLVIDTLIDRFSFERPELMYERVNKASNSTAKSNKESQEILRDANKRRESKKWLVEKWAAKVTEEQIQKTFEILTVFNIDFYEKGNFMPKSSYLLD
ncbi:MAG: sulfotransferase [Bacteroidota bacterium]